MLCETELLGSQPHFVLVGYIGITGRARVNEYAIAKPEGFSFIQGDAAVSAVIGIKVVFTKYVRSKQPISPDMPESRMIGVLGVIEDGHSDRVALDASGIVNPW